MISFINSWAQGIILAVIIATIIEILLPEGNNKKYVKTIIGIYIMFVMVEPLISKVINKNINFEKIIQNTTTKISSFEESNSVSIETNGYIQDTYRQKLEDDITQNINEKRYNIIYLNLNIETQDEEKYGQIKEILMKISKIEEKENNNNDINNTSNNKINSIQNVEIKVSNSTNADRNTEIENVSENEIETLKEYLSNNYGVSKDKIHINE